MAKTELAPLRKRRSYPKALKAQIVAECDQPGASIAGVALSHGANANLVHKWIRLASRSPACTPCIRAGGGARNVGGKSPHRDPVVARPGASDGAMACQRSWGLRGLAARVAAVIRIDAIWLATEPLDMRASTETALARAVAVFGIAHPHHAYCFANRRANRMKVLVHDGIGVWLAKRSGKTPIPLARTLRHTGGHEHGISGSP